MFLVIDLESNREPVYEIKQYSSILESLWEWLILLRLLILTGREDNRKEDSFPINF